MISNSSPLIFLAKINQLDLLEKVFKQITIPKSVKEEILIKGKPGYFSINNAIKKGWIKIDSPKNNINLNLGKEENEAVNLAKEKKDKLIIDDLPAIKIAKEFKIETVRTTTIIFLALEKNLINKKQAISLLNQLIDEGYYIGPKYYSELLTKLTAKSKIEDFLGILDKSGYKEMKKKTKKIRKELDKDAKKE